MNALYHLISVRNSYATGLEPIQTYMGNKYMLLYVTFYSIMRILCSWCMHLSTRMTVCKHVHGARATRCDRFLLRLCVSPLKSMPSVRWDPESPLQSSSDETCRWLFPPPEAPNTQHCSLSPSGSHDARHPERLSAGPPDTCPQCQHRLSTSIFLASSCPLRLVYNHRRLPKASLCFKKLCGRTSVN